MAAYVAGSRCGWLKVKMAEWRQANSGRWELFQKVDASTTPAAGVQPQPVHPRSNSGDARRTHDMAMLHRFTLKHHKQLGGWALIDQTGDIWRIFATKTEALARGELEK